ncbi:glycosyltransferase family 2 protein [Labrys portucalensis]|uniref:Glycosyltransferase family 2 protein n=1 Tax=Labrys neptuniae TaxID=376174 RepID=A0ABV6Z7E8_9HYPH
MIAECLECLLNQTYRNIRIIISDNASTDGTQAIVERYAAVDNRITYLRRPENVGPVRNFRGLVDAAQRPLFLWRRMTTCPPPTMSSDWSPLLIERRMPCWPFLP